MPAHLGAGCEGLYLCCVADTGRDVVGVLSTHLPDLVENFRMLVLRDFKIHAGPVVPRPAQNFMGTIGLSQ